MGLAGVAGMVAGGDDPATAPRPVPPRATVYRATGQIGATVSQFRAILGPANGGIAGEQPAGRREINWDGAATIPFNNRNDFPADFFNTTVKAGAVFTTPGTGFPNDSTLFSEINPDYATQFLFFTAPNLFAPIGSNQLDQSFQVAGQPTPAVVRGFGVVFSDVDLADKTTIQLFREDGSSLGTYNAPGRSGEGRLSLSDRAVLLLALGSRSFQTDFLGCMIGEIRNGVVQVDRIAPADVSPLRSTAAAVVPEDTCEEAGWTGTVGMIHSHPTAERCWYYFPGTQVPTSDAQSFVRTPYAVDAIMCGAKVVWIGPDMIQREFALVGSEGAGGGL